LIKNFHGARFNFGVTREEARQWINDTWRTEDESQSLTKQEEQGKNTSDCLMRKPQGEKVQLNTEDSKVLKNEGSEIIERDDTSPQAELDTTIQHVKQLDNNVDTHREESALVSGKNSFMVLDDIPEATSSVTSIGKLSDLPSESVEQVDPDNELQVADEQHQHKTTEHVRSEEDASLMSGRSNADAGSLKGDKTSTEILEEPVNLNGDTGQLADSSDRQAAATLVRLRSYGKEIKDDESVQETKGSVSDRVESVDVSKSKKKKKKSKKKAKKSQPQNQSGSLEMPVLDAVEKPNRIKSLKLSSRVHTTIDNALENYMPVSRMQLATQAVIRYRELRDNTAKILRKKHKSALTKWTLTSQRQATERIRSEADAIFENQYFYEPVQDAQDEYSAEYCAIINDRRQREKSESESKSERLDAGKVSNSAESEDNDHFRLISKECKYYVLFCWRGQGIYTDRYLLPYPLYDPT